MPVRCGKCGHVFEVSADSDPGGGIYEEPVESAEEPEFEDDDVSLETINIPKENEIEVDGLFDEVEEDEEEVTYTDADDDLAGFDDFEDPELEEDDSDLSPKGPTEAYLESVNLSDQLDDDLDEDSELDEITSDEKFDLFLKPNPLDSASDVAAKQIDPDEDRWPDIHDETAAADKDLDDFVELDDLAEIPDSTDYDSENPLELQEMTGKKGSSRLLIVILLVILLVLLGVSGWFYFQTSPPENTTPPPVEAFSKQSRLKLLEPLKGRFATNENSGKKIFILEGEVRNDYPAETAINWIEVKGALFDKNRRVLSESTAYAGSVLSIDTLQEASSEELKAIRQERREVLNLELEAQQTVPFQILFFDVGDNIQKLQAQINRFSRKQGP